MLQRESLVWHQGLVSANDRQKLLGQRPLTLWLTGLSGAGKSTLAAALEKRLIGDARACYVLDGDNVRHGLNQDLGFSPHDRKENIRRVAEVARLMNDAGLIVVTAFISPYRDDREIAREIIGSEQFLEVYLSTPLAVCELRDPKGFYRRARQGGLADFTGVSAPYEEPLQPEVIIDTNEGDVECSVEALMQVLQKTFEHQGG
jgi:adenylyl-sulfate kinase